MRCAPCDVNDTRAIQRGRAGSSERLDRVIDVEQVALLAAVASDSRRLVRKHSAYRLGNQLRVTFFTRAKNMPQAERQTLRANRARIRIDQPLPEQLGQAVQACRAYRAALINDVFESRA